MTSEYIRLAKRLRDALTGCERLVARAESLRDKALRSGDDGYWDGAALTMQSFYTGVEQAFVDVARLVDDNMPAGAEWHRTLLTQMVSAVPMVRPVVITGTTQTCLNAVATDFNAFAEFLEQLDQPD
jgi:hypothetical protein